MTRWGLMLAAEDYRRTRRRQLGREIGEAEVRAVNGFVEYLLLVEYLRERDCPGTHEATELLEAARLGRTE